LRLALYLVPYVGGFLVELFGGRGQQVIEERREKLFRSLGEQLKNLDEQAIRKDYFVSEEGFDLLLKAIETAIKTRSEEKIEFCARILAGAARVERAAFASPEEYLHLIADLSPKEIEVALWMYVRGPTVSDEDLGDWHEDAAQDCDIDRADLLMVLNRLQARGLIDRLYAGQEDQLWVELEPLKYAITTAFKKLMAFIKQND
jgi:hypothetical protein